MRLTKILGGGACLALSLLASSAMADWRQFRGNDNSAVAEDAQVPSEWDEKKNVAWKADIPGKAVSGPIVVGDKVVATSSSGYHNDLLHVNCYDTKTGEELWAREFWATGRTLCHPTSAVAAPTPASDGKRIFAFYSSNDLICLDLDGNLLWLRGLAYDHPTTGNDIGMASSPLVVGDTVIVQLENQGESFVAGIDTATGKTKWRIDRPHAANWASPTLLPSADQDLVLLQNAEKLIAVKPSNGEVAWSYDLECKTIASATVYGDTVIVPADGLVALKTTQASNDPFIWRENRLAPGSPSPVVYDGKVYILKRPAILVCGDVRTGEVLWQLRVKGNNFWATPVIAGGKLFIIGDGGTAQVIDISGEEGKALSTNDLGEGVLGSPAVSDNALYIRSVNHLWKIANE